MSRPRLRKLPPKPKWARCLTAKEWRHLVDIARDLAGKEVPSLRDLRDDAETCTDCARILRVVERNRNVS